MNRRRCEKFLTSSESRSESEKDQMTTKKDQSISD